MSVHCLLALLAVSFSFTWFFDTESVKNQYVTFWATCTSLRSYLCWHFIMINISMNLSHCVCYDTCPLQLWHLHIPTNITKTSVWVLISYGFAGIKVTTRIFSVQCALWDLQVKTMCKDNVLCCLPTIRFINRIQLQQKSLIVWNSTEFSRITQMDAIVTDMKSGPMSFCSLPCLNFSSKLVVGWLDFEGIFEFLHSTGKLLNRIYAPILKWIIQLMMTLSRKEMINEPTASEGILIYFPLTVLVGVSQVDVKMHLLLSFIPALLIRLAVRYNLLTWVRTYRMGFFLYFGLLFHLIMWKLTMDCKMARKAHLAWGPTGGSTYCPNSTSDPDKCCSSCCLQGQAPGMSSQ